LNLARTHGTSTIAFPSISTGAYRFPIERACRIDLAEIENVLSEDSNPKMVLVVCFNPEVHEAYERNKTW
jgi:O-acetyl-ADP-ribose deacetylase (regulator of RNase III)